MMMTADAASFQTKIRGLNTSLSPYLLTTLFAGGYLLYAVVCFAGEPQTVGDSQQLLTPATIEGHQRLPATNYQQISEWHLFGQPETITANEALVVETQLQLKLLGTFVSSVSNMSMSAVIQSDDGSQKKYKVGDKLPGGAALEEVFANRVLLSHNGRRESLALQRLDASLASHAQ